MTWRDRYIKAAFRGIPFLTTQSVTQVGQRRAVYELPQVDRGVIGLPLGRTPRKYQLSAVFVGYDYDQDRDKLIKALEDPNPGVLSHPYFGSVLVVPSDEISITESPNQGGMCSIAFNATEAFDAVLAANTTATTARRATIEQHSYTLEAVNRRAFGDQFDVTGVFVAVRNAAVNDIGVALTALRQVNGTIASALSVPSETVHAIDLAAQEAVTLINTPTALYDTLAASIRSVVGSVNKVADALSRESGEDQTDVSPLLSSRSFALMADSWDLMAGAPDVPDVDTVPREQQRRNRIALQSAIRHTTLASMALTFAQTTFPSQDAAEAVHDAIIRGLTESVLDGGVDADVVTANQDLVAAVRAHLQDLHLARVVDYTPFTALPAVVLAYERYGDAQRESEILALNQIQNPAYLPAGEPLKVLSV